MTVVIIILIILIVLSLLWILALRCRKNHPAWDTLRKFRYAHRGLHNSAEGIPENSMAAFRLAAEQGYGVVYGSVQPLIRRLEAEHFGRAQGDSESQLTACDLLVLDDLGMEFDTPFSRACLYNVLNARLLEGRPTVISTNLSYTALQERYGDQIASRISGGFVPLLCVGKDIRQIIRRQSLG